MAQVATLKPKLRRAVSKTLAVLLTLSLQAWLPATSFAQEASGKTGPDAVCDRTAGLTVSATGANAAEGDGQGAAAELPLVQGTYLMMRSATQGQLVEMTVADSKGRSSIRLLHATGKKRQIWRAVPDSAGRYTFVNRQSGKVLGVKANKVAKGARVCPVRSTGSLAQKWYVVKAKGAYCLESAENRKLVVSCAGNKKADKTSLVLAASKDTMAFSGTGRALGVAGSSAAGGADVAATKAGSSTDQRWRLVCGKDGFYTVRNVQSGLMLTALGRSQAPGARVYQAKSGHSDAQRWAVRANADGTYALVSKYSGMALAVKGGKGAVRNVRTALPKKAKAQKLKLRSVPLLADGTYTVYTALSRTHRALQVADGSFATGARIVLGKPADSVAQRFEVASLGDGTCAIQCVATGKYLAEVKGRAVQKARTGKKFAKSMRWIPEADGSGIALSNAASGKRLAVAGAKTAVGTALKTAGRKAADAQRFRFVSESELVPEGMYAIRTASARSWLEVAGWYAEAGDGLELGASKSSNYSKYLLDYAGDGWYRIASALSDKIVQSTAVKKNGTAAVRLADCSKKARQLWKPVLTDSGIAFRNKATGRYLEFSGKKAKKGAAVRATAKRAGAAQSWYLADTELDLKTDGGLCAITRAMPGGWGSKIYVSDKGTGYRMSAKGERRLRNALDQARNRGYTASFAMVDLETGVTITSGVDSSVHGASTFKAAYVTFIYEDLLETGWTSNGSVYSLMNATVGPSSNDAYASLRNQFGSGWFRSWLDDAGMGWLAKEWYPRLSARQLACIWAKIRAYEVSGGGYVSQWHKMFGNSQNSCIREGIGSWEWVYSKPGWYPQSAGYAALNDAAIVWDENDRAYLLVILTDANCNTDHWIVQEIARAADALHWEMCER